MTRLLAIAAALVAMLSVFGMASASASPRLQPVAPHAAEAAMAGPADGIAVFGKLCAKAHGAGIPCNPLPAILPAATGLPVPPTVRPRHAMPFGAGEPAGWVRHYRPPRPAA